MQDLNCDIDAGVIVAVSTGVGLRVSREEMMAAAMRTWQQGIIKEALGEEAVRVLPEAIRLVELRARVPRYQRQMLHYLAQREGPWGDDVLTRELEDMDSANAEELSAAMPGFAAALAWP